jgi:hypothetical protein
MRAPELPPDVEAQSDSDWALWWSLGYPIAGTVAGDTDQTALLDCLRVRFASSLYERRPAASAARL